MSFITARKDTWLKRSPEQSSSLAADQKVFVPKGSAHAWDSINLISGESHYAVRLSEQPDSVWWFWPAHFEIQNDILLGNEEEQSREHENPLKAPKYSQRDNYTDPHGTCYSSANATMLKYIKPDSIKSDDDYLRVVLKYGESISPNAQIKALAEFGVEARFRQDATWSDVESLIDRGVPVPMGILHKGPVSRPVGGGHWIVAVGYPGNHHGLIVHDPYGDMDLVNGGYPGSTSVGPHNYSRRNLGPRWMVEGNGSGWIIEAVSW